MKAEAFADKDWDAYWKTEGPQYLASGWVNVHPHIPVDRVGRVCAVEFLCQAIGGLTLKTEEDEEERGGMDVGEVSERGIKEEEEEVGRKEGGYQGEGRKTERKEKEEEEGGKEGEEELGERSEGAGGINKDEDKTSSLPCGESELKSIEEEHCEPGSPPFPEAPLTDLAPTDSAPTALSDEDIATLWHQHYNSYYWYCFQLFKQWQKKTEDSGTMGEGGGEPKEEEEKEEVVMNEWERVKVEIIKQELQGVSQACELTEKGSRRDGNPAEPRSDLEREELHVAHDQEKKREVQEEEEEEKKNGEREEGVNVREEDGVRGREEQQQEVLSRSQYDQETGQTDRRRAEEKEDGSKTERKILKE